MDREADRRTWFQSILVFSIDPKSCTYLWRTIDKKLFLALFFTFLYQCMQSFFKSRFGVLPNLHCFLKSNLENVQNCHQQSRRFTYAHTTKKTFSLHKKWSFILRISSVNVAKFEANYELSLIYWRNP